MVGRVWRGTRHVHHGLENHFRSHYWSEWNLFPGIWIPSLSSQSFGLAYVIGVFALSSRKAVVEPQTVGDSEMKPFTQVIS